MDLDLIVDRLRRQRSDDAAVEVKSSVGRLPKDVWKTVSAFANTKGGLLILGLDESKGFLPAVGFDPQPVIDALSAGLPARDKGASPKVSPVPDHGIERAEVDGSPVVVVEVEPLREDVKAPCFVYDQGVENGSYRRRDDRNEHLSTYEVFLLARRTEYLRTDREPVPGAEASDLDRDVVERVLEPLRQRGARVLRGVNTWEEALGRLNALDAKGRPTLAGVLALGGYPQQFFPQLFVDVVVHPGVEKAAPQESVRFLDRRECDGPIPEMVDDAVGGILANLRTRRVVVGAGGRDVPEIPAEVLREAVTNALVHRDYSPAALGQQVAVDIFPNRVEISNPGGLWGGVTTENIASGQSRSRNDALAKLLTQVPLAKGEKVIENQGSGVPLMVGAMRANGLPQPEFAASIDRVTVTLFRHGLLDEFNAQWLADEGAADLSPHQQMALVLAKQAGGVAVSDIRRQLGIDSDEARRDLLSLVNSGFLLELGADRFVRPLLNVPFEKGVTGSQSEVLRALQSSGGPLDVHELAAVTGRTTNSLRRTLREMVASGMVVATAPPTSRHRAYRLPR